MGKEIVFTKVIVFGAGAYYRERKEELEQYAEIVAFIDNNAEIQGRCIDGRIVSSIFKKFPEPIDISVLSVII